MQPKEHSLSGGASSWPKCFSTRRIAARVNQTEIEFVKELWHQTNGIEPEDGVEDYEGSNSDDDDDVSDSDSDYPSEDDTVGIFLRGKEMLMPSDRDNKIKEFCEGATLTQLESFSAMKGKKWKGSIDDITQENKLLYRGVLNAWEFFCELRKPVRTKYGSAFAPLPSQRSKTYTVNCRDFVRLRMNR